MAGFRGARMTDAEKIAAMTKTDPTRNTRAARHRAATRAQGGAQINTRIGPDAAAALALLRDSMTMREAVERGLIGLAGTGNSGQAPE